MYVKNRFKNESPLKDYSHMRNLASRLKEIMPEYDVTPKSNGYEIDIKSSKLRYKRVKIQRFRVTHANEINYRLSIPEKGRSFDCGRLPELQNNNKLKKALDFEIKAIDGSW